MTDVKDINKKDEITKLFKSIISHEEVAVEAVDYFEEHYLNSNGESIDDIVAYDNKFNLENFFLWSKKNVYVVQLGMLIDADRFSKSWILANKMPRFPLEDSKIL